MSDSEEEPPKWFEKFFHKFQNNQTEQLASLFNHNRPSSESTVPPAKRQKSQGGDPLPHHSPTPPPHALLQIPMSILMPVWPLNRG